jgi:hypothetical protein
LGKTQKEIEMKNKNTFVNSQILLIVVLSFMILVVVLDLNLIVKNILIIVAYLFALSFHKDYTKFSQKGSPCIDKDLKQNVLFIFKSITPIENTGFVILIKDFKINKYLTVYSSNAFYSGIIPEPDAQIYWDGEYFRIPNYSSEEETDGD